MTVYQEKIKKELKAEYENDIYTRAKLFNVDQNELERVVFEFSLKKEIIDIFESVELQGSTLLSIYKHDNALTRLYNFILENRKNETEALLSNYGEEYLKYTKLKELDADINGFCKIYIGI